jgi:hypothetical protein
MYCTFYLYLSQLDPSREFHFNHQKTTLMATGEWTSEDTLMQFGLDAEKAGAAQQTRPPVWVDIVELARQKAKRNNTV